MNLRDIRRELGWHISSAKMDDEGRWTFYAPCKVTQDPDVRIIDSVTGIHYTNEMGPISLKAFRMIFQNYFWRFF